MKSDEMTADRLQDGAVGRVIAILAPEPLRRRLLGLGLLPGALLRRRGDALIFALEGASLVLNRRDAARILVHEVGEPI